MSKFDKYKTPKNIDRDQLSNQSSNVFDKYRNPKAVAKPEGDSPSRIGQFFKGALSGFSRAAMSEAADQAAAGVMDVGGVAVPISERTALANIPQKGIESLEAMRPRQNDGLGNIFYKAGEFGGGVASFPMMPGVVSGATGARSLLSPLAKEFGKGATIGAGSGMLQEGGVNPLAADLASSVVTPSAIAGSKNILNAFRHPVETVAKVPLKIMGLTPKRMNIEAAEAAKDLGIELPAAALTDSTLTGLADQWVGKTPFFGNRLKKKYASTQDQTLKALNDIYDKTGPLKAPEVEAQIANLYNEAASTLPKDAVVKPTNLKKAIDDIKINTAILSPDEKNLLQSLETIKHEIEPTSKLVSQYGPIKVPLQEYDVNKLIGTKKSLNSMIKWDMDEGVKNQLRKVQKAISRDIAEYGKANPEWYQNFKEADSLFGKVARREKLENLIGKSFNSGTDNLSYNALSKAINNPEKQALLKKQVDPETFDKLKKLGTVAKAMAIKSANIPNPSGTAMTTATLGVVSGLITNPVATLSGSGIGAVIGAQAASQLLTDQRFLDLALKLAKKPNNSLTATALNKRLKDITGYSAVALNNEIGRLREEGQ